jgi:hypothetical protein
MLRTTELAHERADTHGRHGVPVGIGPFPYDFGAPRLDQQPVPVNVQGRSVTTPACLPT